MAQTQSQKSFNDNYSHNQVIVIIYFWDFLNINRYCTNNSETAFSLYVRGLV